MMPAVAAISTQVSSPGRVLVSAMAILDPASFEAGISLRARKTARRTDGLPSKIKRAFRIASADSAVRGNAATAALRTPAARCRRA